MHFNQFIRLPFLCLWVWMVSLSLSLPAFAQGSINKPTLPDGSSATNNFFADFKKIAKGSGEVAIYSIYALMWVVAGWLIIGGAIEGRKRGEWGNFWLGLFIALILVLAGGYFLSFGEESLGNLN